MLLLAVTVALRRDFGRVGRPVGRNRCLFSDVEVNGWQRDVARKRGSHQRHLVGAGVVRRQPEGEEEAYNEKDRRAVEERRPPLDRSGKPPSRKFMVVIGLARPIAAFTVKERLALHGVIVVDGAVHGPSRRQLPLVRLQCFPALSHGKKERGG